jgi:hypothetical protein
VTIEDGSIEPCLVVKHLSGLFHGSKSIIDASIHPPRTHRLFTIFTHYRLLQLPMRQLSSTTFALLSSLPHTLSQQLSLLPANHHPDCQYPSITSVSSNFIYFTSPNESDFQFSIYTEWDRWYPNVLRSALLQAGFSLGMAAHENESKADNCGWHDVGSVSVGGWDRGTITFKAVTTPAKASSSLPKSQRPPVVNITAARVPRQPGPQSFHHGHPLSYFLSYPMGTVSFSTQHNRTLRIPRNISPQGGPQVQTPIIPATTRRATPHPPPHLPQKKILDLIRTILLTNSPEADIALFVMEIVGTIISTLLLFCILVFLSRTLGRLFYPLPKPGDEDGDIELDAMRVRTVDIVGTLADPFTDPMKSELARVVPNGDERMYTAKTKAGVPRSSSIYSRSIDGVTLY